MNNGWLYEDTISEEVFKLLDRCAICPKCGCKNKDIDMKEETMTCKKCGEIYK